MLMGNAIVWTEKIIIPTYSLLEDDINPMLEERLDPYPYTLQNHRSYTLENVEHEAVMLENDYLKLIILPNMGGRLFSAFDKINNREVFYKNAVIKPRMIGTRGGWISGGIEFNFPISHSPATMDRVNYSTSVHEDGSASIEFGNIELISGMNWKVELRLYRDKAYIEQNVTLYNPTRNLNRFYFWTNAAVDMEKSVKLIYPFDWCINQIAPNYIKWPFFKGRNYSNASEVTHAYETFGKLMAQNFFGTYSMDKQYGVVHYADRKNLKGAKFFTWGNDQLAAAWNGALTDDDSEYLEVQSGPFESQAVFKFMKPHQQLKWKEYWYPVSNINGFVHAEKELALNIEINGSRVEAVFYPTESIENCRIVLNAKGGTYTRLADLICGKVHREVFEVKGEVNTAELSLDVYGNGKHLVNFGPRDEFMEEQPDTDLYEDSRVNRGKGYSNEVLNCAAFNESFGNTGEAIKLYNKYLERNPDCLVTMNRLGNIYLKKGLLAQAEECFKKVLAIDNRNSEARFMMASILKGNGDFKAARKLFEDIACDSEYYAPSVIEFVKLSISRSFYKDAQDILEANDFKNSYHSFLKSIAYRKDSMGSHAADILEHAEKADEYIFAEKFLLGLDKKGDKLLQYVRGDEKLIVLLALEYTDLGLWEDAGRLIELVQKPGIKAGLLKQKISSISGTPIYNNLEQVLDMPLDHVFINEKPLVDILEKSHLQDSTGKAAYLLGTYYHAMGRKDEAMELYMTSYQKGLRYTVLLRNLGLLCYSYKKDFEQAARYLREDIDINKGRNESSIVLLYKLYEESKDLEGRKSLLPYMKEVKNKSLILNQMAETLRDSGHAQEALKLLESEEFENWEGVETSGRCYKETIICLALQSLEAGELSRSLEYIERIDKFPKGLNFGNSARSPLARERYYKGLIYSENGLEQKAVDEFRQGAFEPDNEEIPSTAESRRYAVKCLGELKKKNMHPGE